MQHSYRPATTSDADELFELRRGSILALAPRGMSEAEARSWALKLAPAGMAEKLKALEIWVSEADGQILGWAAIKGDRLEGLYTGPAFAGRGVGSGLLSWIENLMRERKIFAMRAVASPNAIDFYLGRGFAPTAPRAADRTLEIEKRLGPL